MEGDELTASPLSNADIEQSGESFSDELDRLCAYYMALGVSCDDFWNGDYTLLKFYVDTYQLAVERQNEQLWLQGLYFYEAIGVALSNAFAKHSTAKYPDKPHRITPLSEREKEAEQKKQVDDFRAQLMAASRRFEAKHKREQERGGNLG